MKKTVGKNKALSIILMVLLIVASFLIGGMSSFNARYEKISSYKDTRPVTYNKLATEYNEELERFPGIIIKSVMPVKGPLTLVQTNQNYDEGIDSSYSVKPIGFFGVLILVIIAFNILKVFRHLR